MTLLVVLIWIFFSFSFLFIVLILTLTLYCVQLILVGVCCSSKGDGTDPFAEVSLQPLPQYTIPSDGVTMTCITCTDRGHIFLAGRDGHIYEIQYTTGSGWHKRCRKVCLTAGLGGVISRYAFLNYFPTNFFVALKDYGRRFKFSILLMT